MPDPARPYNEPKVPCAECHKEILASEALSSEAVDYVHNFCGMDCLDRWRKHHGAEQADAASQKAFSR